MKKTLLILMTAAMIACAREETTTTDTLESEAAPITTLQQHLAQAQSIASSLK